MTQDTIRGSTAFADTVGHQPTLASPLAPEALRSTRTSVLPRIELGLEGVVRVVHEPGERYRTMTLLGAGGMGEVERAEDVDIGRSVAIKRLLPNIAADATSLARFIEEVRIAGRLEHPNVVPIHDVGLDANGRYFFVMKYAAGETLERIIERLQAGEPEALRDYSFERRIELFIGVLNALAYAHAQGVVHRDVKPANVMVGRYGEVWLMDWGVAKRAGELDVKYTDEPADPSAKAQIRTTRHGSIVGTPAYMSPEQARGDIDRIDARSDLYSACVMFHELVTLRHYLDDRMESLQQLTHAIQTEEPTLSRIYPTRGPAPAELIHFIRKGLQKDPALRYQSAEETIAVLHGILEGTAKVQCHATFTKRVFRSAGRLVDRHPHLAFVSLLLGMGTLLSAVGVLVAHAIG